MSVVFSCQGGQFSGSYSPQFSLSPAAYLIAYEKMPGIDDSPGDPGLSLQLLGSDGVTWSTVARWLNNLYGQFYLAPGPVDPPNISTVRFFCANPGAIKAVNVAYATLDGGPPGLR